ncbi:MAG: hypothetical protein ABJC28_06420 [Acidobacteriota bacterium]
MRRRPRVWRLSAFLPLTLSCQMLLAAHGRWSPAGPPGSVSALTIDAEGRVYAVTAQGMSRSEDAPKRGASSTRD